MDARHAPRELPVIRPDEEVLDGKPQLGNDVRRNEQRHKRGERAGLQLGREVLDRGVKRMPLTVHRAGIAIRPQAHAREIPVVAVKPLAREQQLAQGVGVGHAVIVHDPDKVIPRLDRNAHAKVETTGTTEVLPRVVIDEAAAGNERRKRLLRAVRARVVNDDDRELVGVPKPAEVLGRKAVEALEQKLLAVVGHDDGRDAPLARWGRAILGAH